MNEGVFTKKCMYFAKLKPIFLFKQEGNVKE